MRLPSAPPPDPTNEFGDLPAAAAFGKTLFEDAALSPAGVSCAKCHDATKDFTDGLPQSVGASKVDRNSPSIALAAHARWQFWDGRADTLWMQALGPPENALEMASNRLYIAHQVATRHAATYASVFGPKYPLPDLSDLARFPTNGKPGDAAWEAMAAADRDEVTRVYVNVGKAIAAFERSLRVLPNALDRYADGDTAALTEPQKDALQAYFINGCAQCHWGPRMTDDAFHVLRFPTGRQDGQPDRGRIDVFPALASAEFVASSKWSESPGSAKLLTLESSPSMLGAFKTPPLRGVARTAPYGHGGSFTTLLEVAKHYGKRGDDVKDDRTIGNVEEWVPLFDANVQEQMPRAAGVAHGRDRYTLRRRDSRCAQAHGAC
jgi:cytochrome c peroxidase